jgi:hypothetical protein
MTRRRLPIGIQTFRTLRERGCCYVDKTAFIEQLLDEGTHYFLSRPRRFGKSLFLDTLKELFEGLHIHARHDWSERHPVVRLSFGGSSFTEPAHLHANVLAQLEGVAEQHGVSARYATGPERFAHLLRTVHGRAGQRVVVLVDEYDLDMAVRTGGHVYLFEFKVVEMATPGAALTQLRERDYAAKYRGRDEPIHLVGVEFSRETRNVTAFEVADG